MSTLNGGPGNIITDGLIFYIDAANYSSYTSGSTVWTDLTAGNINGILTGSTLPTYTTNGKGSFFFTGSAYSQAFFGNPISLVPGVSMSVFLWINQAPNGLTQAWSSFCAPRGSLTVTSPSATGWRIATNTSNILRIQFFSGSNNSGIMNLIGGIITSGSWQYIGFTLAGTIGRSYLNGIQAAIQDSSPSITDMTNSGSLVVGYENNGLNQFPASGSVALMQIYNRTLTAAEVLQNYNAQKTRFGL